MGLGMALTIAMYDFFGYYQVCYLADEVADASRTIPRSILISVLAVGLMYLAMNVTILGVLPWPAVVASNAHRQRPDALALRPAGGRSGHDDDRLDGARLGFRRDAGLQPDSLRIGAGWAFLQGIRNLAPQGTFPHRSLLLIGGLGSGRLPGRA